jgi:hypothetical protein
MNFFHIIKFFVSLGKASAPAHAPGVLPKHWTKGMLGFPPTEENQHEEEQIYR